MRALNLISFSKPVAFQAAAPFAGRQNLRWAVQTCQAKLALILTNGARQLSISR
jgi:hypothetical protein